MRIQLLAVLFAGVAFGGTIPVTGSGTFSLDNFKDTGATVRFSGSDGTDSVSFASQDIPIGPQPPSSLSAQAVTGPGPQLYLWGSGTIDGIESNYWGLDLGRGPGYLTLLDASGNVLISQAISGNLQTTSYQENGPRFLADGSLNYGWTASGTFLIVAANNPTNSVPESGSAMLVGVGMFAVLAGRRFVAA
jgi:hypothetical protein